VRRHLPAVLLVLGCALPACSGGDEPGTEVEQRLPALIAFVERERGLELRREVPVEVLDDEQFLERYRQDAVEPTRGYDLGTTYGALGLDGLDDVLEEQLDETLAGFYDGAREELVVRDTPVDPYLELVLVHELTHALQDQWFKVDRPELWDASERLIAFNSVVEGDATRVERAWYQAQPERVRQQIDEVSGRLPTERAYDGMLGDDPVAIELDFAYVAGLRFVDALLETGGQERLDEAFRHPPTTTEQVLHPELLDAGPPTVPPAPQREGELVDQGVLGERGLALVLGVDPLEPDGPQVGWDGDSYATFDTGDGLCTVATVQMDTPAARDRLLEALELAGVLAEATSASTLQLESCA
jgi:hypothetical protein